MQFTTFLSTEEVQKVLSFIEDQPFQELKETVKSFDCIRRYIETNKKNEEKVQRVLSFIGGQTFPELKETVKSFDCIGKYIKANQTFGGNWYRWRQRKKPEVLHQGSQGNPSNTQGSEFPQLLDCMERMKRHLELKIFLSEFMKKHEDTSKSCEPNEDAVKRMKEDPILRKFLESALSSSDDISAVTLEDKDFQGKTFHPTPTEIDDLDMLRVLNDFQLFAYEQTFYMQQQRQAQPPQDPNGSFARSMPNPNGHRRSRGPQQTRRKLYPRSYYAQQQRQAQTSEEASEPNPHN